MYSNIDLVSSKKLTVVTGLMILVLGEFAAIFGTYLISLSNAH